MRAQLLGWMLVVRLALHAQRALCLQLLAGLLEHQQQGHKVCHALLSVEDRHIEACGLGGQLVDRVVQAVADGGRNSAHGLVDAVVLQVREDDERVARRQLRHQRGLAVALGAAQHVQAGRLHDGRQHGVGVRPVEQRQRPVVDSAARAWPCQRAHQALLHGLHAAIAEGRRAPRRSQPPQQPQRRCQQRHDAGDVPPHASRRRGLSHARRRRSGHRRGSGGYR
jgi:hypothetical protein